jgi:hypothetical protein
VLPGIALILATLVLGGIAFRPSVLHSRSWRATVTPLASIIGSGFLVAGPILGATVGSLAWAAMLWLCAVAYLFGSAVRYNILHVEPLLAGDAPPLVRGIERASELALSLAYFVSVAYYLNLFAAFALRLFGIVDPVREKLLATLVIGAIGATGAIGGLRALERLELAAVNLKLAVIGGVCAALAAAAVLAAHAGHWQWAAVPPRLEGGTLRTVMGLVILVQGFETSRFLGAAYEPQVRVRTMRHAQWIATGIYLLFIVLITRLLTGELPPRGGETQIVDLLRPVTLLAAPMIMIAALASQSSAAVADLNGAGGLLSESLGRRVNVRAGNLITALVAIAITWGANIYQIIADATRAFVLYYALQCAQATLAAQRRGEWHRMAVYGGATALAAAIAIFATAVEA